MFSFEWNEEVLDWTGLVRVHYIDMATEEVGIVLSANSLLMRGTEVASYIWVYERFCICSLPWDSPWTWLLCFLGTDLGYYWFHRAGHGMFLLGLTFSLWPAGYISFSSVLSFVFGEKEREKNVFFHSFLLVHNFKDWKHNWRCWSTSCMVEEDYLNLISNRSCVWMVETAQSFGFHLTVPSTVCHVTNSIRQPISIGQKWYISFTFSLDPLSLTCWVYMYLFFFFFLLLSFFFFWGICLFVVVFGERFFSSCAQL